ncbi:predicted redox protein, regulator of disulfide bond formation [Longilinea arvoryzae]|uniref:Predicted redox protein, regulator of disulfide bond formation n=1 Tax=Longilinea arvoryzae TaxID=360412 RepID=A0A0S7BEY4_9CHLR|nr:OsmC family protein [Longilinea arvoryzae]GAP12347.1 predicted redox protein, regulator of disulfide bond formation [Longilinea arvoryzae]
MPHSTVRWIGGKQFIGVDSAQHSVVVSTAEENVGMSPSDLLLVALASCTAVDVVEILQKKRQSLTSLEIQVDGEQDAKNPWPFRKIHLMYRLKGSNLDPKSVDDAIRIAEEKYCTVAATIRGVAEISYSFEILE